MATWAEQQPDPRRPATTIRKALAVVAAVIVLAPQVATADVDVTALEQRVTQLEAELASQHALNLRLVDELRATNQRIDNVRVRVAQLVSWGEGLYAYLRCSTGTRAAATAAVAIPACRRTLWKP